MFGGLQGLGFRALGFGARLTVGHGVQSGGCNQVELGCRAPATHSFAKWI